MATKPHRSAAAKTIKPKAAPHGPSEAQDKPAKGKTAAAAKPPAKKTSKATKPAAPRKPGGAAVSGKPKRYIGVKTLTPKVIAFVQEYLRDFNGRQAAIRAGYSQKTADQAASRLLRSPAVKSALNKQSTVAKVQEQAQAINRMELTVERTRLEIARIAYFDPRKLFAKDGRPLSIAELDDDTAAVIAGLDVLEAFEGSGEDRVKVGEIKKWKLADKNAALDKAAKILGDYSIDNKQKAQPLAEALAGFVSQIHQSGAGRVKFVPRAKP